MVGELGGKRSGGIETDWYFFRTRWIINCGDFLGQLYPDCDQRVAELSSPKSDNHGHTDVSDFA